MSLACKRHPAISAWNTDDSFTATVQSALVSTLNDCVARIVDAFDLAEVGSPYVSLRADESSIAAGAGPPPRLGAVRVWVNSHADGFEKLVHLHVFSARMTSHALFAFTAADSAVPHFSLGISATDGSAVAGFHVDLVSKVPHAAAPAEFAEAVYGPLAETRASVVAKLGGAGAVELSPVQREVMSRALIALRAAEGSAAPLAVSAVHVYLNHWLHLHRHRASLAPGCAPAELHRQDAMMRALLFSAQDPLWLFLDRAIGRHQSLAVRDLLRNDYAISGGEQMSRDELHSGLLLASTSMPPSSPEGGTSAGRWEGQVASASISGVLDLGSADLRELPPFVRESASLDSLKRLSLSGNELSELSLQAGRLGRPFM